MKTLIISVSTLFVASGSAIGQTWQRVDLHFNYNGWYRMLDGVFFQDTGIVMSEYGYIYRTNDFFETYSVDSAYPYVSLGTMSFPTRTIGYITSAYVRGGFLKTYDGGLTWNPLDTGSMEGDDFGDILAFINPDTGYSADSYFADAYRLTDSGESYYDFSPLLLFNYKAVYQMRFINASTGYILCNDVGAANLGLLHLLRTNDYGTSWQEIGNFNQWGGSGIGDFYLLDDTTVIVTALNQLFKLNINGDSIKVMSSDSVNDGLNNHMQAISFINHDTGFATFVTSVYKTYNGGDTWIRTDFAFDSSDLGNGIMFIKAITSDKVILGCFNGNIYKSTIGGGVYTGVSEIKPIPKFTLYPNPTSGLLKITPPPNNNGNYNIEISNLLGQTICTTRPYNNQIDVTNLAPGMYLLKTEINGVYETAKFVKQ